jgi:hypothetical protein
VLRPRPLCPALVCPGRDHSGYPLPLALGRTGIAQSDDLPATLRHRTVLAAGINPSRYRPLGHAMRTPNWPAARTGSSTGSRLASLPWWTSPTAVTRTERESRTTRTQLPN